MRVIWLGRCYENGLLGLVGRLNMGYGSLGRWSVEVIYPGQ